MVIREFEQIDSWKVARDLCRRVFWLCERPSMSRSFALRDQIMRSSISVMANIAEGFERQSKKDFVKFLNYASASAAELQSHLYVALDCGCISEEEFTDTYEMAKQVKRLINGFINYLKKICSTAALQHCSTGEQ
ncbi:MAG: four helix bundle protein [Actinobacteria bacterium]|nr:four helix bundle protein [Actinomycetota bacterium]